MTDGPLHHGFDYFYGMPASLDQPPFVHIENDRVVTPPDHMIGVKQLARHNPSQPYEVEYGAAEPGFDPSAIVPEMDEKVLSLVKSYAQAEQPFFIYYPTLAVHGPLLPSPDFQGASGLNAYGDFVLQLDDFVGRLLQLLEAEQIAEDTVVIFTSDNGCSPVANFPKLIGKGHNPSHIYRGWKADIWEGGHRVPFVMRWPGHLPAGSTCPHMACLSDLFATLAEITGAHYSDDAGEDSISLWSMLAASGFPVRDTVVHHSADGSFSIRKGVWKLALTRDSGGMRPPCTDDQRPPYQLYRMDGDVTERYNLYGQHPDIEQDLLSTLTAYVQNGRSTPGAPQQNVLCADWPGRGWLEASTAAGS